MTTIKSIICLIEVSVILFISFFLAHSFAQGEAPNLFLPLVIKNHPFPETGKIVFESYRNGTTGEIYRMNADGSDLTRLTLNSAEDNEPDWSPDGSRIAFQSNRDGVNEIYVMNEDGTNQTRITTMNRCFAPQWSPDGTRIAFYTRIDYTNIIYTMNPDGSDLVQVTDPALSGFHPYWSPDGSKIAFLSQRTNPGIYTVNVDGSNPTLLIGTTDFMYFAWSPDGTCLAISKTSPPNYTFDLYLYDLSTSIITRLTDSLDHHNSVDWSPDGYYLIFHSMNESRTDFDIFKMTVSGDQMTNLTNSSGNDSGADWTR